VNAGEILSHRKLYFKTDGEVTQSWRNTEVIIENGNINEMS